MQAVYRARAQECISYYEATNQAYPDLLWVEGERLARQWLSLLDTECLETRRDEIAALLRDLISAGTGGPCMTIYMSHLIRDWASSVFISASHEGR